MIPIVHDFQSMFMLVGFVLSMYLSLVVLFHKKKDQQTLTFFGLLVLCQSLVIGDIYLCYTGLMKEVLFLDDSTESLVLLFGPLIYLFLKAGLENEQFSWHKHWVHFILPVGYFISQIGFLMEPSEIKMNAYVSGFHSELPRISIDHNRLFPIYDFFKDALHETIIASLSIYAILCIRIVARNKNKTSVSHPLLSKYAFSKNAIIFFAAATILMAAIFIIYENDLGDPYIVMFMTMFVLFANYIFTSSSRVFSKVWHNEKYHTSGLIEEHEVVFKKLDDYVMESGFALREDASLKALSLAIDVPANYISQAINAHRQANFNEYINLYRIKEAEEKLLSKEFENLSIEGIGRSVGFRSKSAFYTAFKKVHQTTPLAFAKAGSQSSQA